MKVQQGLFSVNWGSGRLGDSCKTTQPGKQQFETLTGTQDFITGKKKKENELCTESYEYLSPPSHFTGKYTHLLSPGHPHSRGKQIRISLGLGGSRQGIGEAESCFSIRHVIRLALTPAHHLHTCHWLQPWFLICPTMLLFLYYLLWFLPNSSRNVKSEDRRNGE